MLSNKLFATFTSLSEIDNLVYLIREKYSVLYNKIFILNIQNNNEYVCTYNVDYTNLDNLIENTILLHRKKETNSLYTINSLNELIKSLNKGNLDKEYKINWNNYKNSILLIQNNELKEFKTKVYKIIDLKV